MSKWLVDKLAEKISEIRKKKVDLVVVFSISDIFNAEPAVAEEDLREKESLRNLRLCKYFDEVLKISKSVPHKTRNLNYG